MEPQVDVKEAVSGRVVAEILDLIRDLRLLAAMLDVQDLHRQIRGSVEIGRVEDSCGNASEAVQAIVSRNDSDVFLRGDANGDHVVDVSDDVFTLLALFQAPITTPSCWRAVDANDGGSADVSDAIYSLQHLFTGGPAPSVPFPTCGWEHTGDELSCEIPSCQSSAASSFSSSSISTTGTNPIDV